MAFLLVIAVSLVVVYGMFKLADHVFVEKPKTPRKWTAEEIAFHEGPDIMGTGHGARRRKDASPEDVARLEELSADLKDEDVQKYLNKVRDEVGRKDLRYDPLAIDEDVCTFRPARPPSTCIVCGDPMKQEGIVETCDCCQRGYLPRS